MESACSETGAHLFWNLCSFLSFIFWEIGIDALKMILWLFLIQQGWVKILYKCLGFFGKESCACIDQVPMSANFNMFYISNFYALCFFSEGLSFIGLICHYLSAVWHVFSLYTDNHLSANLASFSIPRDQQIDKG